MATTFAVLVGDIEIFRQNSEISTSPQFFPQCALAGRLDIFKEVELRGITWHSQENYYAALFTGRVKLLTWLLENDPPDSIREILEAMGQLSAELGKLKTLKWLRGIPEFTWTEIISKHAAIGGHVDILDYIWENGLPIDFLDLDLRRRCARIGLATRERRKSPSTKMGAKKKRQVGVFFPGSGQKRV
jgi:hypothetical protein